MIKSKSGLAIMLSKLRVFEKPSQYREQYTVDSEVGASVLWFAYMGGDIKDKIVADLGAGTGLLGLGALLLGAKKVFLIEIDEKAVEIINDNVKIIDDFIKNNIENKNIKNIKINNKNIKNNNKSIKNKNNNKNNEKIKDKIKIINNDIKNFNEKVDTVIQNPPFGVKRKHADKEFLEKAFKISDVVYSFHKLDSDKFIDDISNKNNFKVTNRLEFDFPIKQTMKHHRKRIHRFKVGCWRMEKL